MNSDDDEEGEGSSSEHSEAPVPPSPKPEATATSAPGGAAHTSPAAPTSGDAASAKVTNTAPEVTPSAAGPDAPTA